MGASGTLPAAWVRTWAAAGSAPVLFDATSAAARPDSIGSTASPSDGWTSAEALEAATRRAAGRLWQLGAAPGDRVVWSCRPSLDAVVAALAVLRAGLVLVPANPDYRARELGHVVADVRPAVAVIDEPARAAWASAAAIAPLAVAGPDLDGRAAAGELPGGLLDVASPSDPALIGYTSGTTGAPKGAVLTHGNLLAGVGSLVAAWRWEDGDRLVHALPLFHAHGLCVGLFGTLLAGASAVLLGRFDPQAVVDACGRHHATLFFGVPTMYHRLAGAPGADVLGRLRLAVSGSAPLPPALHRRVSELTGCVVLERYGLTETLMNTSNPVDGERRPGTVGFPLPGVEVRLARSGSGSGREGEGEGVAAEIFVRGPNVSGGYWERPAADAGRPAGGWFATGDLGAVDTAGYLRILGRSKELVISGGFNVYPAEVEDVLGAHPAVREVAVTGTPSDEWGEVVTAWVVPSDGGGSPDLGRVLQRFAAERLAPYKCPRIVRFLPALPRTALGKVQRAELR